MQFNWNDTVIASGSESGEIILFNVLTSIASSPLIHNNAQVSYLAILRNKGKTEKIPGGGGV